jgi:RimJ/RimL family protein N-acetyltransferase
LTKTSDIEAERLLLRPVDVVTARVLLEGRKPDGSSFAEDYPSEFSLEVMDLFAGARSGEVEQFLPYFMIRKADAAIIGEIGSSLGAAEGDAHVGYSVVASCQGRGYATEALRAVLPELLARVDVRRVVAVTTVEHTASRRVMEKADMSECGRRSVEEDGDTVEHVVYEARPG